MERNPSPPPVAYRAFAVNDVGRLGGLPEIIVAADDSDAVLKAERLLRPQPIEVWEGTRLVARVPVSTGAEPDAHARG